MKQYLTQDWEPTAIGRTDDGRLVLVERLLSSCTCAVSTLAVEVMPFRAWSMAATVYLWSFTSSQS